MTTLPGNANRIPPWVANGNGGRLNDHSATPAVAPACQHCARIGAIAVAVQDALHELRAGLAEIRATATELRNPSQPQPAPTPAPAGGVAVANNLTRREYEILHGLAAGHTFADIGRQLGITEDTSKSHGHTLYRKLGVHDRGHAIAVAYDLGLLQVGASKREAT